MEQFLVTALWLVVIVFIIHILGRALDIPDRIAQLVMIVVIILFLLTRLNIF